MTNYAITGAQIKQTAIMFFFISMVGNIINVGMEEGIFRGFMMKLLETKDSFIAAVIFSSFLFGIWHIAAPIRSLLDGEMSTSGAIMAALMLTLTAGITGAKFALLVKITGSLWMPMADHFVNNTVINILHVATTTGVDEMQVIRISIAQSISFIVVLIIYWKTRAHGKPTFRG